jgi:CubicO group peptidase (beta-lactamase class C family)
LTIACIPISQAFPSWGAGITLRHLLHHTSGLPGYIQFFSTSEDITELTRSITGIDNEDVLERTMRLSGPEFPEGSQYSYSSVGYVLLAIIVAIISGQSFPDFLRLNVFEALGMKHTLAYDSRRPTRHRLAHGYLRKRDHFERWDYPMLTVGDGGLFSTLSDLFLWNQALNTERLVSKATLRRTFTSGTNNDGAETGYGFGRITNVFPYLSAAEHR